MRTNFWSRVIGYFVDSPFVVLILLGILITSGIYVSPFNGEGGWGDPVPVDAIPDIGENQQIVFTTWPGRSPKDIEDQVTYPLTTALLGLSGVKAIRSNSMFGFSSIYVIFDEGADFHWSRSRLLEKLAALPPGILPPGVSPTLGPDATALGQVFWYTLEGRSPEGDVTGGWDLHELRSLQDWTVRYALQSVPGVAEVASIGGYVKEYQVDVDPEALRAHGVSLAQVAKAVSAANAEVGARTVELNQVEYLVRGVGFVRSVEELEAAVVAVRNHTPIRVSNVARVMLGPAERRGALDKAGAQVVGGVVVARYGENPMAVIQRVKAKIDEITPGLPRRTLENGTVSQVRVVPFYDRSSLIEETLDTLSIALWQQILLTIVVVLIMLRHLESSLLISSLLPLAVLGALVAMKITGVDANIMSLAGIAIAIGTMVDMGIVFTENIVARLSAPEAGVSRRDTLVSAAAEVAPAVLTSALTTVVSFLPVFALTAAEGRLFRPLAFTKTYALAAAYILALVVLPVLARAFLRSSSSAPKTPLSRAHTRDWVVLGLGVLCWLWLPWWVGTLIVLAGLVPLLVPWLPARWAAALGWLDTAVAVAIVGWVLTTEWMPLGPQRGLPLNLLFVVSLCGVVLGGFLIFLRNYRRLLGWCLAHKGKFLLLPALLVMFGATTWLGFDRLFAWLPQSVRLWSPVVKVAHALPGFGREFMPPFDEGSFLYMPTTMPHASVGESLELLQQLDAAIATIPEVDTVVGKLGRAESPLDPAPVSMFETVVSYIPEYRTEPDGTRVRQWRDHIRTPNDIWNEITRAADLPGLTGAPVLMPIATRVVMLQSGMRAPMGIKVQGPTLEAIQQVGVELEQILRTLPAIRPDTVFADRVVGKPYLEVVPDRHELGRHGLSVEEVHRVVEMAVGGVPVTRTVEGRERYAVRVRYAREERDNIEALRRVMVPMAGGDSIPLQEVASLRYVRGPQMIKSENTFLTSYVTFDKQPHLSEVEVVQQAEELIDEHIARGDLELPAGVSLRFAGSYENQVRSEKRLAVLVPLALSLVFLLLYLQFRRLSTSLLIYSGVVVSVAGGFLLLWLYNQPWFLNITVLGVDLRDLFGVGTVNMSVAVWVGVIALVGIATDDGVLMSTYLDQAFAKVKVATIKDVRAQALEAGLRRVRPCLMTTATTILALLPVITSRGRGSDVMVPMAIPLLGGMLIELITLFVVPVLYSLLAELRLKREGSGAI